jgi:hypothetical protein
VTFIAVLGSALWVQAIDDDFHHWQGEVHRAPGARIADPRVARSSILHNSAVF